MGTSLIVIIPEGVETLYSATRAESHSHARRQVSLTGRDARLQQRTLVHDNFEYINLLERSDWWRSEVQENPTYEDKFIPILELRTPDDRDAFNDVPGPVLPDGRTADAFSAEPPKTPTEPGEVGILTDSSTPNAEEATHGRNPHAWIGVSLILGFILMYLIDTLPGLAPTSPPPRPGVYSLDDLSGSSGPGIPTPSSPSSRSLSTTLGLVIHAAADGIALGASSTQPSLSFIIFLAIMIHKAPAAFGLTSVLLSQGLGKRAARAHLVIFSLAAPLGAVGAWTIIRVLGGGGTGSLTEEETMRWWTGVLLLFSGGTFLYIRLFLYFSPLYPKPSTNILSLLQIRSNAHNAGHQSLRPLPLLPHLAPQPLTILLLARNKWFPRWTARLRGARRSRTRTQGGWDDVEIDAGGCGGDAFAVDYAGRACALNACRRIFKEMGVCEKQVFSPRVTVSIFSGSRREKFSHAFSDSWL